MSAQLNLLDQWEQDSEEMKQRTAERKRIEYHQRMRRVCWPEWAGPEISVLCEISASVVQMEEGGTIYAYMEQCRLLERRPDGTWLAEIEMGEVWGKSWPKDGTRLLLEETDIWPPVRHLSEARRAKKGVGL